MKALNIKKYMKHLKYLITTIIAISILNISCNASSPANTPVIPDNDEPWWVDWVEPTTPVNPTPDPGNNSNPADNTPVNPAPDPGNNSNPGTDPGAEPVEAPLFSPNAQRLFNYLTDIYGSYSLSGQMDTAWTNNSSMDMITRVFTDTGKYPAIKGFDLIEIPNSWSGYGKDQIDEAIEWWDGKNKKNGASTAAKLLPESPDIHGIVTFCWHWKVKNSTSSVSDFYSDKTDFRIPMSGGKLDKESAAFKNTIKPDLDKAAALLKYLKDKDIPVLWRPLHEAAGNYPLTNPNNPWFWWGASGPQAYICLWEYMYDYFTNEKGLDNLIWVWNGQNKSWLPNPDTVDIVSFDYYVTDFSSTAQNYSSQKAVFDRTKAMVPTDISRMVALSENGAIPDPDNCKKDNAMWLWFMVWNDSYNSKQGDTSKDNFWTGDYHNTQAHKEKVYNHELVITLDELPDITKYRLE